MKLSPYVVEKLFQGAVICTLLSLLTFCIYSGYETSKNEKSKSLPTKENQERWEHRKYEYLQGQVCETLEMEVENARKNGTFCSRTIDSIIVMQKKFNLSINHPFFDAVGMPMEYRSMEGVNLTSENLICNNHIIERWRACSTGFSYGSKDKY
jgi:hypothetical protein